jgi:kexin
MKFWGSTIDATKATKYELPLVDNVLPPVNDPTRPIVEYPTETNTHPRPTAPLDDEPTVPTRPSSPAEPNSPPASESDEEDTWFTNVSDTVTSHKTFFSGIGALGLISTVAGVFLWRRRAARRRLNYDTLPANENLAMSTLPGTGGPHRTREAYDAGDDEGRHPQDRVSTGLGFHSGFLDDDELSTAGPGPTPKYRDEPEVQSATHQPPPVVRISSPSPRLSGDESWEHARAP